MATHGSNPAKAKMFSHGNMIMVTKSQIILQTIFELKNLKIKLHNPPFRLFHVLENNLIQNYITQKINPTDDTKFLEGRFKKLTYNVTKCY